MTNSNQGNSASYLFNQKIDKKICRLQSEFSALDGALKREIATLETINDAFLSYDPARYPDCYTDALCASINRIIWAREEANDRSKKKVEKLRALLNKGAKYEI